MKNTDKVTLTFGQLKRLIKESTDNNIDRIRYIKDIIDMSIIVNNVHAFKPGWTTHMEDGTEIVFNPDNDKNYDYSWIVKFEDDDQLYKAAWHHGKAICFEIN